MRLKKFNPLVLIRDWYTPGERTSQDRMRILISNYNVNIINYLTGSAFWTGLLILMNADDAYVGIIALIPYSASIFQFIAPFFWERFAKRKKLIALFRLLYYFMLTVFLGFIPIFPFDTQSKLTILMFALFVTHSLNAFHASAVASFHLPTFEEHVRPAFFSFITSTSGIISLTINLLAGKVIDIMRAMNLEYEGLLGLRIVAFFFGLYDCYLYLKIKEYPYTSRAEKFTLKEMFTLPVKEKRFRRSIMAIVLYNLAACIPGSYHTMYLLNDLHVDYAYLNFVTFLSVPLALLFAPLWKRLQKRWGWFKTLSFALIAILPYYFGLAIVEKNTVWIYLASSLLAFMISAPGISMINTGIAYYNIPKERQTIYSAFYSAMANFAAMISVYIGKSFIGWTQGIKIQIGGISMGNKQYICIFTGFLLLLASIAIYYLARQDEKDRAIESVANINC